MNMWPLLKLRHRYDHYGSCPTLTVGALTVKVTGLSSRYGQYQGCRIHTATMDVTSIDATTIDIVSIDVIKIEAEECKHNIL